MTATKTANVAARRTRATVALAATRQAVPAARPRALQLAAGLLLCATQQERPAFNANRTPTASAPQHLYVVPAPVALVPRILIAVK